MEALFCPLSADLGNWADWANVFVAAAVGIAVWRVSNSVAKLELQRELEAAKLRQDEQRLILVTMANHISIALVAIRNAAQLFRQDGFLQNLRDNQETRDFLSTTLWQGVFTIPEGARARMHFVEMKIAAQILRAEGAIPFFLKSIEAMSTSSADNRVSGSVALSRAVSRELQELTEAWTACHAACREAGLIVGPPSSEQEPKPDRADE